MDPTTPTRAIRGATAQVAVDPLRPPAADGWSPDRIVAVHSDNPSGFVPSALTFALGGTDERPGQRLSTAQVDELAPFFATTFGLDEGHVRGELAKVYVYVGGPTIGDAAMTVGHHVFVPDEPSLHRILGPRAKRWLVHELAHTLQFLSYAEANPHRFLSSYLKSMVVGVDPQTPGRASGPPVWGALFTGLRATGKPEGELGAAAVNVRDRLASSVLPGIAVGLPAALASGFAIGAARNITSVPVLGTGGTRGIGLGVVAAPALLGSLAGAAADHVGLLPAQVAGGALGAASAGLVLARAGAFSVGAGGGNPVARIAALAGAGIATAVGGGIGALAATASANTIQGWSRSAPLLHANRPTPGEGEKLTFEEALHDAHWLELDAEVVARRHARGEWRHPNPGAPVSGRVPHGGRGESARGRVDSDLHDRLDWGLWNPAILGIPAAGAAGVGVFGSRVGATLLRERTWHGRGPFHTIGEAVRLTRANGAGVANSLRIGAAMTLAPAVIGGIAGPIAYDLTGSAGMARIAGGAAGAAGAGALLTILLRGSGGSPVALGGKVLLGMGVAAGVGLLTGGVAADALRVHSRSYVVG